MTQLQRVSPTNSISPWIQNRISRRLKNASTITRNNSIYVIHSPYPTCTTVVENNIYKAIDRLASMSRSPPKINAESNISHGYSRWMQIYPSWFFLPLLSPFNLEKPNEITQNVYIYIRDIYLSLLEHPPLPPPNKQGKFRQRNGTDCHQIPNIISITDSRVVLREIVGRRKWRWRELPAPGHASSFTTGSNHDRNVTETRSITNIIVRSRSGGISSTTSSSIKDSREILVEYLEKSFDLLSPFFSSFSLR